MHQAQIKTDDSIDFGALLEASFEEQKEVQRGDILSGTILAIDKQGIIIDLGQKRDGVIPRGEVEAVGSDHPFEVGQHVTVMVVRPEDQDGNLLVSVHQARALKDWDAARTQMESGELYQGQVIAANHGGLIVPFGDLRGFVPASHVLNVPRGLDDEARAQHLSQYVGKEISLKIIEVNPARRRLVLSQREAQKESRDAAKDQLLANLKVGDTVHGHVSSLRDFGAFIDIGGADGLVHVSELAWRRVRHPNEILSVGMEVDAYVLQLDRDGRRIGLSLKRLERNPWVTIEERYKVGQDVEGTVSRVVSFGAFVELEDGIEALLHQSHMGTDDSASIEEMFKAGDTISAVVISLEPDRQRMGLSLKDALDMAQAAVADEHDHDEVAEVEADAV